MMRIVDECPSMRHVDPLATHWRENTSWKT
jgi:hypothetical protein